MVSREAISLLSSEGVAHHQRGMETTEFQELRRRGWSLVIKHIYRNHATDYLAGIDYGYTFGNHVVLALFLIIILFTTCESHLISINSGKEN
ncbi:hypothetical protein LINPERHAP2_LOCUS14177 [Linum perenne]